MFPSNEFKPNRSFSKLGYTLYRIRIRTVGSYIIEIGKFVFFLAFSMFLL